MSDETPETFDIPLEEALKLRALYAEAQEAAAKAELAEARLQGAKARHARAAQALNSFYAAFEKRHSEDGAYELGELDLDKGVGTRTQKKEPQGAD